MTSDLDEDLFHGSIKRADGALGRRRFCLARIEAGRSVWHRGSGVPE